MDSHIRWDDKRAGAQSVRLHRGRQVIRHGASRQRQQAGADRYDQNEDIEREGPSIGRWRVLRIL